MRVMIGRIINTRGLKGEVKVENHSSFVKDRFKVGNSVLLSNDDNHYLEKKITHFNYTKGFVYLYLDGIDDIDEANKYRDYTIYYETEDLKETKDVVHLVTLMNMDVYFKGEVIGKVINIESNGRQDILRIEGEKKQFLVPFLNEFIKDINKEERYIEFRNIEVFYED